MRKAFWINKIYLSALVAAGVAGAGGDALAVGGLAPACANQTDTSGHSESCPLKPIGPLGALQQDPACLTACNAVQQACSSAQQACSKAGAADAGLQQSGAASSQAAAAGAGAAQQGTELGNAANMCSGQNTQQARADLGKPLPSQLQKCIDAAQKCQNQENMAVQQTVQGTQKAKTAVEAENAARTAEAAEMAGKCSQSAQNADKMGQMPQMPQMPQSPGSGAGSGLSDLTDNSDVGKQDTKVSDLGGETARIDAVSLGDASNAASVEGIPSSPISAISGNSEGFAGSASGGGGKDFAPPPMRGTMGKLNGSGASGDGAGGIHSGVSKEGDAVAAGAAGKAENNANEINFGGGARNMLGLKPKEGEEDLSALAAFAAGDTPKVAGMNADASGQGGRGLASVKGSHATTIAEDASSIFKMVKTRYLRLQGNGKI